MKIIDIIANQILDSRANPTLEVKVILEDGSLGIFQVPSGASKGIHEAYELRDNNKNFYFGKSVLNAVKNIQNIKSSLLNIDFTQELLDEKLIKLDGSSNKKNIGANAILGISIAFAKASAIYYNLELYEYLSRLINKINFTNKTNSQIKYPSLFANILNGGLHSGNELNIQEFMLVPNLEKLDLNIQAIVEIYHKLKILIEEKYSKSDTCVGDEGGFAPKISKTKDALDLLVLAIKKCGYESKVFIALDAAASDFFDIKNNLYEVEKDLKLNYKELTNYYNDLIRNYPIISIEDAMAEDDFKGFSYFLKNKQKLNFTNFLNNKKEILSVGDDLLVTNPLRIKTAIDKKLCNSLLLKINQIGTLSESILAYQISFKKNWQIIVSHRSGETTDNFISDLAIALNNSSIKLGAPARGERVAKYNRLLEIYNSHKN